MASDEAAAITLLKRAVDLDSKKRLTEALVCYKEGLKLLMDVIKACKDEGRRSAFRAKAKEYMHRAEVLDRQIETTKHNGQFHEQIRIEANSVGHSYQRLFGRFLDANVTSVFVEDPYIRSHHQIMNFVRFCELLVSKCPSLSDINLISSPDQSDHGRDEQGRRLDELRDDLKTRNINLSVSYSDTLHDREIRLNTGWIIKVGRGLDIYRPSKGKAVIGQFDMALRPCHETTIDIFHNSVMLKPS